MPPPVEASRSASRPRRDWRKEGVPELGSMIVRFCVDLESSRGNVLHLHGNK